MIKPLVYDHAFVTAATNEAIDVSMRRVVQRPKGFEDAKCLGCGRDTLWVPGTTPGTPRCSHKCAAAPAAVAWYRALLRIAPSRTDASIDDLIAYAKRAPALHAMARRAILESFADYVQGTIACPTCNHGGPHTTNRHHRFFRLAYTCSCCGKEWKAVQR